MVVRLADVGQEKIRVYEKNGHEVEPSEVGNIREKEPDATDGAQWSVSEAGTYMLFYYRVLEPEGWPDEEEMMFDAPEYCPREWVTLDREHQETGEEEEG